MATSNSVPIDERLIRVSIEIAGQLKQFDQQFAITSTGTKFANPLQNEATVKIANLTKADRDYLLTATSPFNANKTSKILTIEVGRVSTGLAQIYKGNIATCLPSAPPDVFLEFKCKTGQFLKGKLVNTTMPAQSKLSAIAAQIAKDTSLNLNFQATDKNIANYNHSGSAIGQITKLGNLGPVSAYQDDDNLVVKDLHLPLTGKVRVLDKNSGMIGVPGQSEFGIKVKYLLDNTSVVGGGLTITSVLYPAINGNYCIFKLGWELASREEPFYWNAEAAMINAAGNVVVPNNVPKQKKGRKKK